MDNNKKNRVNHEIKGLHEIRLIGEGQTGKITTMSNAIRLAKETGLDLVEINPNSDYPVIKLMNYEKFLYERKKQDKKNKHNNIEMKEIRLSVNIASNDIDVKLHHAENFIKKGHKVKVVLTMRGRELSRKEDNKKVILNFIVQLDSIAVPESLPREEGNKYTVILKPKK